MRNVRSLHTSRIKQVPIYFSCGQIKSMTGGSILWHPEYTRINHLDFVQR
jgi:hypothetical protein